jgi:hypothetical protein
MIEEQSKRRLSATELKIFVTQSFLGAAVCQATAVGCYLRVTMSNPGLS